MNKKVLEAMTLWRNGHARELLTACVGCVVSHPLVYFLRSAIWPYNTNIYTPAVAVPDAPDAVTDDTFTNTVSDVDVTTPSP